MRRLCLQAAAALLLLPPLLQAAAPARALAPGRFSRADMGLPDAPSPRNVLVDLDGDGWLDAVCANRRVLLSRPAPDGRARRFTAASDIGALADPCGDGQPASLLIFGDVDGDGDEDAFAARFQEPERPADPAAAPLGTNAILLNDGRGRFTRLEGAGVEARAPIIAATFLDADHDGILDLATGCSYEVYGDSLQAAEDRLYRGLGGGRFEDATARFGLALDPRPGRPDSRRPTYGLTHTDWNGDGYTDLVSCSYGRQWNRLWLNEGGRGFREAAAELGLDGDEDRSGTYPAWLKALWKERYGSEREDEAPFRANGNTFDAACADADNDGDIDLLFADITHAWAGPSSDLTSLYENLGPTRGFRARRRDALPRRRPGERWNQGDLHAGWLDADQDGLQDLLLASSDYPDGQFLRLFRQQPDHSFADATLAAGLTWEGAAQPSIGDVDGDGDLDILIGRSLQRLSGPLREGLADRATVWRNDGPGGHWSHIRLVGAGANRSAIGARIRVWAGGLMLTRELRSSLGHAGHQDAREAHFGLGWRRRMTRLEVRWPDATLTRQVFRDLPADRFITIVQGQQPRLARRRGR